MATRRNAGRPLQTNHLVSELMTLVLNSIDIAMEPCGQDSSDIRPGRMREIGALVRSTAAGLPDRFGGDATPYPPELEESVLQDTAFGDLTDDEKAILDVYTKAEPTKPDDLAYWPYDPADMPKRKKFPKKLSAKAALKARLKNVPKQVRRRAAGPRRIKIVRRM